MFHKTYNHFSKICNKHVFSSIILFTKFCIKKLILYLHLHDHHLTRIYEAELNKRNPIDKPNGSHIKYAFSNLCKQLRHGN